MSRERHQEVHARSSISTRRSRSFARRPASRRPDSRRGIYASAARCDTRLSRRGNRSNGGSPLARERRDGKKKRGRRDEFLQDGGNFILARTSGRATNDVVLSDPLLPPLLRRSPIMLRARRPRRWFCQHYRNRFPPVVYLTLDQDFSTRSSFTLLIRLDAE